MNGLKEYTHVSEEFDAETGKYALYAYDVNGNRTPVDETELVYLKSEADKMIAELEESHKKEVGQLLIEITGLKTEIEKQKRLRDMALASVPNALKVMKINQHHKYKRCLAMARWCENAILGWMGYKESFSSHQRYIKVMLFTKWHKRWLKIAEKFKPNN